MSTEVAPSLSSRCKSVFKTYLPLAFFTFGGPQAHIAIFHDLFVDRLHWVSASTFVELFAIAQSLPGPASTQLAFSIALVKHGLVPGLLSFLVWSIPGMVAMTALAYGVASLGASIPLWAQYTENGLTSAAVGLVAIAAFKLGKKILQDRVDMLLALFACLMAINVTDQPMLFPLLMIFGASVSYIHWAWNERQQRLRKADEEETDEEAAPLLPESAASPSQLETIHISYNATTGLWVIGLFVILLIVATTLPLVVQEIHLNVLFTFYTIGSLIFGGGPVVIPLIQNFMLKLGWMASQEFLIGLAIINSLPGPMFNIAAFCGALALRNEGQAGLGAVLGYIGIFAPGLILKIGLIPLWQKYRGLVGVQRAFKGVNSSAVGLVFAAVYLLSIKCIVGRDHGASLTAYPIYVSIAATTFTLVEYLQVPAPILIIMGGVTGYSEYFIHSRA